jgi:hypothetical protein
MSDLFDNDEELAMIALEEAIRCRRPNGSVDFGDLLRAVGARLPSGFQMIPARVLLEAKEAVEAIPRLH